MSETEVHRPKKTARRTHRAVLLDGHGRPLPDRISQVLRRLAPRLTRQFVALRDEGVVVQTLERAGLRILRRELRDGPVRNLEGYAWITLVSVANSFLRTGPARLVRKSASRISKKILSTATAEFGTVEQVERAILIRELLELLPPQERLILEWRLEGLTSQEIAIRRGCSVTAVDILLTHARRRLRIVVRPETASQPSTTLRPTSVDKRRPGYRNHSIPPALLARTNAPDTVGKVWPQSRV